MQAIEIKQPGGPEVLVPCEVAVPQPGAGQVDDQTVGIGEGNHRILGAGIELELGAGAGGTGTHIDPAQLGAVGDVPAQRSDQGDRQRELRQIDPPDAHAG